jgi:hypothetical protein
MKSMGTPLFEASLVFTLPDDSVIAFPALWGPTGSVIPQFSAEDFDVVGKRLKQLGKKQRLIARVTLKDDPAVSTDIAWVNKYGFTPVGNSLAQWVRAQYPEDCAYLDEVPYPAIVYWKTPCGGVLRMPALWLNTGEVRLRPPEKQLNAVMEMRHAARPGDGRLGYVVLSADPTIVAAIHLDDEYSLVGLSHAFSLLLQTAK